MYIDEKIKDSHRDMRMYTNPPKELVYASMPAGPMRPECLIPEDEFSPATDMNDFSIPSKERVNRRTIRTTMLNDFTSSITSSNHQATASMKSSSICIPTESLPISPG